jgi:hypothetical protein
MIWHPLLLAIIGVDIVTGLLTLSIAASAFRIALYWNPASSDRNQIALETRAEIAGILGRWVLILLLFSGFLLTVGISNVFHPVIPGAMCGTGVLQALGQNGQKMLFYRALWVTAIFFWYEMDRLNRMDRSCPLTGFNARLFLASTPLAVQALIGSVSAFNAVDPHQPVDCCAVVYDQFRSLADARSAVGISDGFWLGAFLVLSMLFAGLALGVWFSGAERPRLRGALALTTVAWLPVAAVTLINILSAYYYGVLHHHCPWCLFLPQYNFVGYLFFGALAVIAVEGLLVFFLPLSAAIGEKPLLSQALRRSCRACNRMLAAFSVFMLLACLPPLIWRFRHGVWMGG